MNWKHRNSYKKHAFPLLQDSKSKTNMEALLGGSRLIFFFQDWFFHNQFGCDSFLNVQCKGIHTPATTQLVCSSLRSYTVAMSLLDVSLSNFFLKNFHWVLFSEIQINIKWTWINTKCSCKSLWYIGFCPLLIKLVSDLCVAACRDHKVMWFIVVCYRN